MIYSLFQRKIRVTMGQVVKVEKTTTKARMPKKKRKRNPKSNLTKLTPRKQ